MKAWCVYLLECSDETIYTGITNDLEARIAKHNAGTASKYTRTRAPVRVLKSFPMENKSSALKEEDRIKQLTREEKLKLVNFFVPTGLTSNSP